MTIRETLLPLIKVRLSNHAVRVGKPPHPIALFPAAHPAVGDVRIYDHGPEATICLGEHTHWHCEADPSTPADRVVTVVANQVIEFLEALFSDRVIIWSLGPGRAGGWQARDSISPSLAIPTGAQTFLWSGPTSLHDDG